MIRLLLIGLASGAFVVLAGAAAHARTSSSASEIVTRDGLQLPAGCAPRELASLVSRFFDAFNRAEWEQVDAGFAPSGPGPEDFKLFSWERDVVQDRDLLIAYLSGLQARGERFRLIALRAAKEARVPSSVAVDYVVQRPAGLGVGKGLIDCDSQRIWQWAMGPHRGGLVLPCPRPAGWSLSGPIVACTAGPNARSLALDFRVGETSVRLPAQCGRTAVRRRLTTALSAFNLGIGDVFARQFVRRGQFHPYTGSIHGSGFVGRSRITPFVRTRYRAGDGWTATRLGPPRGGAGLPTRTVYGLDLRVSYQGSLVADRAGAKLVVDCRSGLLQAWIGPALKAPPIAPRMP